MNMKGKKKEREPILMPLRKVIYRVEALKY